MMFRVLLILAFSMCLSAPGFLITVAHADAENPAPKARSFHTQSILLGAHRGGKHVWPENTVFAFQKAAERWPHVLLELDVHVTVDGHAVVIHDESVDRTTNGTGLVRLMTLEDIQALDAAWHFTLDGGETFPYRGQGITVPTLQEALEAAPNHLFLIEMKDGEDIARATSEAIRSVNAQDRCILAAVPPPFIQEANRLAPEIATCYDVISGSTMIFALRDGNWDSYEPAHEMLALSPALKRRFDLTSEEIARIREKGILVLLFTINDPDEMQHFLDVGVDGILSDAPDKLAALIEARQRE